MKLLKFLQKESGYIDIDEFNRATKKIQIYLLVGLKSLCLFLVILVTPVWVIASAWVMMFINLGRNFDEKIFEIERVNGRL